MATSQPSLLLEFLGSLSKDHFDYLLSKPACALFIFRMLPDVSQQLVIKLIWNANVSASSLKETYRVEMEDAVELLTKFHIIEINEGNVPKVKGLFRRSYLQAIMLGSQKCTNLIATQIDENKRNKDIGKKSSERWECILRYLALASEQHIQSVSLSTRKLFCNAGYTSTATGDSNLEITSTGFQFLLLSPVEQMWSYMIEYMKMEQSDGHDLKPLLHLLMRIILCVSRGDDPSSHAYQLDVDKWTDRQMEMILHMRELGLIFIRKRKDGVFYLTPLLCNLALSDASQAVSLQTNCGNIIVETNFRLYAYTSSSLQLAILSTFTEMTYRFHDMSVGMLSRESVRRALQVGITAAQIISFLRANAHPQCIASSGVLNCLPITVSDQIRLWEDERHRLTFSPATLYSTFENESEYIGVRDFASSEDILLWADNTQMTAIVKEEGHDKVKEWWRQNRSNH